MPEVAGAGVLLVGAAVYILGGAARLFRRHHDGMLLSYFFYLLSWYLLICYMFVYLFSQDLLPKQTHYGYMLFSSIFLIPLHGSVSFFFADFSSGLSGRKTGHLVKGMILIPFLVIFITYSIEILGKLSVATVPEQFTLNAPYSLPLMLLVMAGSIALIAAAAWRREAAERRLMLSFVGYLVGGSVLGILFALNVIPGIDFARENIISSLIFALINIPGFFFLRKIAATRWKKTAEKLETANLAAFAENFGISPREIEVVSLVVSGRSNREIESELFISAETVKKHIYNIYRKVDVKNRVQLVNTVLDLPERKGIP